MLSAQLLLLFVTLGLAVAQVLTPTFGVYLTQTDYIKLVKLQCFLGQGNERKVPMTPRPTSTGANLESLLSLIERLEERKADYTPDAIARYFLARFHIDEYDHSQNTISNDGRSRLNVIDAVYKHEASQIAIDIHDPFLEGLWTDDEKCALFFMLSHSIVPATPINQKSRVQIQNQNQNQNTRTQNRNQNRNNQPANGNYLSRDNNETVELGVVSYRNHRDHAIAADRVLHGALAGFLGVQDLQLFADFFKGDQPEPNIQDGNLDAIMLVTLSDLLASGGSPDKDNGNTNSNPKFGSIGRWASNSTNAQRTTCGERYQILKPSRAGTLAQIRGGIDGYAIGTKIRDNPHIFRNLKLSSILRQYYSPRGFGTTVSSDQKTGGTRFCERGVLQNSNVLQNGKTLYGAYQHWDRAPDVDGSRWGSVTSGISTVWNEAVKQLESDFCNAIGSGGDNLICETPSDLFFLIDGKADIAQQALDIATIAGNVKEGRQFGSTNAFANFFGTNSALNVTTDSGQTLPPGFYPLDFNGTSQGCTTCRVAKFDNATSGFSPINDIVRYIEQVNKTLFNFEWASRTNMTAVPGKTFVLFNAVSQIQDPPKDGDRRNSYNDFVWRLRYQHRDVPIIVVSTQTDRFKDLAKEDQDLQQYGSINYDRVRQRICSNPATFQWVPCYDRRSDGEEYIGYVSPGAKQNWAMYPEYFLKSFTIKFVFRAETGKIRICYRRRPRPEEDQGTCYDIENGQEATWTIENPCHKRSFENCDPFYFTVIAVDTQPTQPCNDDRCAAADQIRWSVKHYGVQCNSSERAYPSWSFHFICLAIFIIFYFSHQKK